MQKEIPKRIPIHAPSIKVIEKRRSDVPLKPRRRKFPSFGSRKMASSNARESSAVIRPSVFSLSIHFPLPFNDIRVSKSWKIVRISNFSGKKHHECPQICEKEEKRYEKRKESPRLTPLRIRDSGTLKGDAKRRPPVPLADKR